MGRTKFKIDKRMRLNPETNEVWMRGDKKGKFIFDRYVKKYIEKDGFWRLQFVSFDEFHRRRIKKVFDDIKNYHNKNTNLSIEYLTEIFPKNFRCPILGIKMGYNKHSSKRNSVNLDKIIPNKNYIKGNVVWCSNLANRIKTDANSKEILKVGYWYKKILNKM